MAVSSPALPPEEQKSPTSGDAEMRRQPIVHDIAATSDDANGSNNMQTTSANTPNPSPAEAEHAPAASAAKKAGAAGEANHGTSAPVQTVAASATNSSNPIINLSSDADKSDATPVPDNEGGQTSTSAAPKGGASTSDRDQDDDKKAEAAKKPKYILGQAIDKVRGCMN